MTEKKKTEWELGMLAHTCDPNTLETWSRGIASFEASLGLRRCLKES